MGRLHTHNHGKAHSTRPFPLSAPKWVTEEPSKIKELIVKYRKEGLSTSQIGVKLRDQHSIPLVKPIIKNTITQVLKKNDLMPDLPEDLNNVVKQKFIAYQYITRKIIKFQKTGNTSL